MSKSTTRTSPPRKRFRAIAYSTDFLMADIWARDEHHAFEIAYDLDGGLFSRYGGDWTIERIEAVADDAHFAPVND